MKLVKTVFSMLRVGELASCKANNGELPPVQCPGKPVEFPEEFLEFADGFSPTCTYTMNTQKGSFTVLAKNNCKSCGKKQTINLHCTIDERKKTSSNTRKIEFLNWKGPCDWFADTTFKRHTPYYATGKFNNQWNARALPRRGKREHRASLVKSKRVQVLPQAIAVTPETCSLEMTPTD
ncbi:hypothetical protein [uncultured Tateyamaria sp.]|uniref:hypothetical protein n=1 Tax=uncultured Tateyamaria sp. TaxID=455651 RepID=UPI002616DC2A|nr:hypothetical protein [uncultured Tateyamaria sp.]